MENIVEGNKKIAEFMGYKYYPHNTPDIDRRKIIPGWKSHPHASDMLKMNPINRIPRNAFLCRNHNQLIYNSDWNWIARVVDKIKKEGHIFEIVISDGYCRVIINSSATTDGPKTAYRNGNNLILVLWNACLDHITGKKYKSLED
jgi:hypothetical protein